MAGEMDMIGELHRLVRGIRRGKTARARSSAEIALKIQPQKEDRAIAPSEHVVPESPVTQKSQARPILDIPANVPAEGPPNLSLDTSVEYPPEEPEEVLAEPLPEEPADISESLPEESADISSDEASTGHEVEAEPPAIDTEENEEMDAEEEVEEREERIDSEPEQKSVSPMIQTDAEDTPIQTESASLRMLQIPEEGQSVTTDTQNVSTKGHSRKKKIIQREETFNEEEYEESKVVRIFNVDHGRKASISELTDRDVVLSTIESVALDFSTEIDKESRKAVREFFIEIRKAFCESVNFQKESRSMKTACTKAQSRIRKQRDQLLQIRQERARVRSELSKLQEEHKVVQSKHENTKNLGQFLSDLSNLQQQMLQNHPTPAKQKKKSSDGPVDLQGQLFVSSTLLGTRDHIKNVNDHLQQWLDEH